MAVHGDDDLGGAVERIPSVVCRPGRDERVAQGVQVDPFHSRQHFLVGTGMRGGVGRLANPGGERVPPAQFFVPPQFVHGVVAEVFIVLREGALEQDLLAEDAGQRKRRDEGGELGARDLHVASVAGRADERQLEPDLQSPALCQGDHVVGQQAAERDADEDDFLVVSDALQDLPRYLCAVESNGERVVHADEVAVAEEEVLDELPRGYAGRLDAVQEDDRSAGGLEDDVPFDDTEERCQFQA